MANNLAKFWLRREAAVLVVVDVQERLVPAMDREIYHTVQSNIQRLLAATEILQLPVVATEQYPRGLGGTVTELAAAGRQKVITKLSFGCCGEPAFVAHLRSLGRPQVIVTGMEAHVCVYQTVLGLLEHGYQVHLVRDAVCSRKRGDYRAGVENAGQAGAVLTTTEMALFQMLRVAGTAEFKAVSALIKGL